MTTLDQLPAEMAGLSAELTVALEDLRSGKPFATLLIDGASTRAAALESLLDQMTAEGTRVVWVGNPLRSPLTLERLFLQTGCAEADLRIEQSPADLTRMLARTGGDAKRLLLIVQQPDKLDVHARETLGRMAPYFADGEPVLQILFCGSSSFRAPEVQQKPAALPAIISAPLPSDEEPRPSHRGAAPLLLLLLLAGLGAAISQMFLTPWDTEQAPLPQAVSAPSALSASAAKPNPPLPADDIAALRREFEAFLAQRAPTVSALNDGQKDALFQEFLERHRQGSTLPARN